MSTTPYDDLSATTANAAAAPAWLSRGRIPSLDGLRAVAIILVLLAHMAPTRGSPLPNRVRFVLERCGSTGVDVFFVISGFLITLLLLRELAASETLSLKAFYARRAVRIFPAYAFYLAVLFAFSLVGVVYLNQRDWAAALTYTTNFFVPRCSWDVGHTWSLSVEEHFYIIWPPLLLAVGTRRARYVLTACIFAAPVIRILLWTWARGSLDIDYFTFARMDSIAIGCLLALLSREQSFRAWAERMSLNETWSVVGFALGIVASKWLAMHWGKYAIALSFTVQAALTALILWACVNRPTALLGRLLNCRVATSIGVLSYSLYLWQQPFTNKESNNWMAAWPQNLVLAVAAALTSYFVIERPFLQLKSVVSTRTSGCRSGATAQSALEIT